jgi:diguanylate cyclase
MTRVWCLYASSWRSPMPSWRTSSNWSPSPIAIATHRLSAAMNPITPDTVTDINRTSQAQDAHNPASHESAERLRLAMMVANDGLWDWDLATNEVYFDPRYYLMAGYAVDAFPHRLEEFQQRVHPDDVAQVMAEAQAHLNGQTGRFEVEFRFRKRDGDYLWILGKGQIVERDAQGRPLRFVGTHSDITERKRAEEALRASEERLSETARIAQVGGWEIDLEGNTLAWTEETFHIHELESDQPPSVAEAIAFYHPDDQPQVQAAVQRAMESGTAFDFEARLITAKKNLRWVRATGRARYRAGRAIGIHGIVQDITERKQSEVALRESEERLELVLEGGQLGYWDWNIQTGAVYRNARWAEMLGYTLEEIECSVKQWSDLQHPDDQSAAWQSISNHLEGRTPAHRMEYRMRTKDGQYKWILDQARIVERDAQGRPLRMSGTHIDITERKQTEEALRESEERFKRVSLVISDFAYSCRKPEGGGYQVDWLTGAIERISGYSPEEILAAKCWGFLVLAEDRPLFVQCVTGLLPGQSATRELRIRHKDGTVRWLQASTQCLTDPYDPANHIVYGGCLDITERKRIEAELQQKLTELQRWYEVMLDREGRVLELKREADALRRRLGEPPLYAVELAADLSAIPPAAGSRP